jgi:hypothetical protein
MELTIVRAIAPNGVETLTTQAGRPFWKVTDTTGQQWSVFGNSQPAVDASNMPPGTLALMRVKIAPSRDGRFMNHNLVGLAAAPAGSQETSPQQLEQAINNAQFAPQAQPSFGMPQPGQSQGFGQQPSLGAPLGQQNGPPQQQQYTAPAPKTLGQGGSLSDADILRMGRSTAIAAVAAIALTADDFRDDQGELDWRRVYEAAEAVSQFITHRQHKGWGLQEVQRPSNEQQVLAEVNAQFGAGTVTQGLPQAPEPVAADVASAESAEGGDVPWD